MNKYLFFICLLFTAPSFSAITAETLTKNIESKGAQKVVNELYSSKDSEKWFYVTSQIEKGQNEWLQVASKLQKGSDASTSEDLIISVATAIPKNPGGVLAILSDDNLLTVDSVCSLRFIDVSEEFLNKYVFDSIKGLYKEPGSKGCIDEMVNTIGVLK